MSSFYGEIPNSLMVNPPFLLGVKSPFESLRPKRKINGPGTTHPAAIPRRGWRRSGKKPALSPGFHVGWSITQFVGDDSKLSQVTKLATSYPHYIIGCPQNNPHYNPHYNIPLHHHFCW